MRGRKLHINWQEDAETLYRQYRAEPDAALRTRLHALWLVRQGHPVTQTAPVVGIHGRTLQQWLAWYREGGLAALRQPRQGGRGKPAYLTRPQQRRLVAQTAQGSIRTIKEAILWVEQQCGVTYTYWGMRSLFKRLKITNKVPRPIASQASLEAQAAWKKGAC